MNTERKLIQQLRDACNFSIDNAIECLNAAINQKASQAEQDSYEGDIAVLKSCVAAADAYLSKQDWIRVEDSLPVVPDDFSGIDVWAADGDNVIKLRVAKALPLPDWYTHWRYAEQTPAPPEQPTTQDAK